MNSQNWELCQEFFSEIPAAEKKKMTAPNLPPKYWDDCHDSAPDWKEFKIEIEAYHRLKVHYFEQVIRGRPKMADIDATQLAATLDQIYPASGTKHGTLDGAQKGRSKALQYSLGL